MRHIDASRTGTPPTIDGLLDEASWSLATPTSGFRMKLPHEGPAATEDTVVRVLYDEHAVYVGVECKQRLAPIVARLTRRDRPVEADWVSIGLDTRRDGRTAFEFTVNAAGVLSDQLRFNDTDLAPDWDENWEARAARTGSGWSAELRIPFRVLRFGTLPVQSWGFEARRYVSARQELDEWQTVPRSAGGEVSRYGLLDGLRSLSTSDPVELWTTGVLRLRARDRAPGRLARGFDLEGTTELDARWHATQELTFEATVNPDFAQVDADPLVLNLTSFETWYPERRAFFLEGSETFATLFDLVYTRRIGRVVSSPVLRAAAGHGTASEQLVDAPGAATIYGATKLVGAVSDGWHVGVLGSLVGRNDADVLLPTGARAARLVEPLTAF
ncbi:MAG: carbohydrate binding family 9 domain-containing protein, partial [Myxococcota bacterium]|nr:carbohydrate binding family 9 domain-containing protein [Myxococcota bacterium]